MLNEVAVDVVAAYELDLGDPRIEPLLDRASWGACKLAEMVSAISPELAKFYGEKQLPEAVWRFVAGHQLAALGADVKSFISELPPLVVGGLPETEIAFAGRIAIPPATRHPRSVMATANARVLLKN
jgi:hypothetical protein